MIFGSGSPDHAPSGTGGPQRRRAPRTGTAPSIQSAEAVKRKRQGARTARRAGNSRCTGSTAGRRSRSMPTRSPLITRRAVLAAVTGGLLAVPLGPGPSRPGRSTASASCGTARPCGRMPSKASAAGYVSWAGWRARTSRSNIVGRRAASSGSMAWRKSSSASRSMSSWRRPPSTRGQRSAPPPTIPIVFASHADPIGSGHVASLARPGGNLTGVTIIMSETAAKSLELLKEAVPGLSRVPSSGIPPRLRMDRP